MCVISILETRVTRVNWLPGPGPGQRVQPGPDGGGGGLLVAAAHQTSTPLPHGEDTAHRCLV